MAERARALVVDDDDPIRLMLSKIIERQGLEVHTARDGAEAIKRIDDDGYNVIVLDLMMPKVDGFAVLEHLRERRPQMVPCTIIASAIPESEFLKRSDLPVHSVHAKPFDVQRLIADIHECVGNGHT
jgi:CheY-like chemotaxis protein